MDYDNKYSDDELNSHYYDDANVTGKKSNKTYSTKNVKCIDAIVEAFERMQTLLFSPFDFSKWFFMGFTAWLMVMFEGGGISFNYNSFSSPGRLGSSSPVSLNQGISKVQDYLGSISTTYWVVVGVIILIIILLFIAFTLFIIWVKSRGAFMFLDNVVMDRAEVKKPWAEFKELGWSAFKFNTFCAVVSGGINTLLFIVLGGIGGYLVIGDLIKYTDRFFDHLSSGNKLGITLFILMFLLFFFNSIVWGLVTTFFRNFCVPIMYKERIKSSEAFSIFKQMLKNNKWNFTRYLLVYWITAALLALIVFLGGCLTLCIGTFLVAIPVIGAVITLPIPVIFQYYNLEILAQVDESYKELLNKDLEFDEEIEATSDNLAQELEAISTNAESNDDEFKAPNSEL